MTVGFSTSSPWASVAVIATNGDLLWHGSKLAPQAASGACLKLLDQMLAETGLTLEAARLFAADIGPGSFTGVRVGVTLAKTFGFLYGCSVAGASSFDLISVDRVVALPSKKAEFFVRHVGARALRCGELPLGDYVGYGPGIEPQSFPDAQYFKRVIDALEPEDPFAFAPAYLIEPSISIPKRPYGSSVGSGG